MLSDRRLSRRALLVASVTLTGLSGCGQGAASPPPAPPPVVTPSDVAGPQVDVRRGDLLESIIVNGALTPTREVALFFRQSGRLKNLTATSGDRVKAGQLVAELEVGTLSNDVTLAEIAMKKAQAKLEQLRSRGADRFDVQLAQLEYDSALISYQNLSDQLEAARLTVPFDGLVTETVGRPGEMMSAFAPVVTVADPTALQVTAMVPTTNDGGRLAIGQPASIVLDKLPNARVPLQVVQLPTNAATLLNGTPTPSDIARRFKLTPLQALPTTAEIGMLGRVTIVLRDKKGVLMVKSTAVRSNGPRRFVQVIQGGRKRDVDVEVGIVTPTDTEIVTGLREGDRVLDGPPGPPTPPAKPGA
ncbi:MAG: efflux RND transporter periplasmic adaptor subunit [Chloroflexi bacterium]|nr:efflux RND transporter periplasmic adaptor subunit [Chloroflexota bacterium]